ncbi:hypothetical protein FHS98_001846 [Sphingomonas oligoaromativorans]|nr:hypothetical protein [Sphingomonas oligoaromativorans]
MTKKVAGNYGNGTRKKGAGLAVGALFLYPAKGLTDQSSANIFEKARFSRLRQWPR